MNTITTLNNLTWDVSSYGGRASFRFAPLGIEITFHPSVGEYVVWCDERPLRSDKSIGVCLEETSDYILDCYAANFVPSWEDEEGPITIRTPVWDNAAE